MEFYSLEKDGVFVADLIEFERGEVVIYFYNRELQRFLVYPSLEEFKDEYVDNGFYTLIKDGVMCDEEED